ncbi:MAG TPA: hypothetical protein VHK01_07710 [Lacipirellulaceae bacterium]|nr:hypothetical protein [Lacipirellulaceae bacterium]
MNRSASIVAIVLTTAFAVADTQTARALTPLNDLGTGLYLNLYQGGLYPNGLNEMPAAHAAVGLARATAIQPLDTQGQAAADGKYALVSIGMSNTTQEFCGANQSSACRSWTFMGQSAVHPSVDRESLLIVNGAAGGKSAAFWDSPSDPDYDRVVTDWLTPNGLSENQVQAAWVKVANPGPTISLPSANSDTHRLVRQMGDIARALKTRYPNLQQVFLSSRVYAGYATTSLNPEPYAYESGFAVKWLIEAQIKQMESGTIDTLAGDLNYNTGTAPWLAWGPYLWADGLNPRSDGLIWLRSDLANDGTHPSTAGEQKVADLLLDFMLTSPFTQPWFLTPITGDYNDDGEVDAADYVVWRKNDGTPTAYDMWRANFGRTSAAGAADTNGTAVPEPGSLVLLLCVLPLLRRTKVAKRSDNH